MLGGDLNGPYQRGRGGPGGWWILFEPGVELPELDVVEVVPDLAGWRRSRLPALPDGSITIAPDWVCEVLSPTTRAHDLKLKRPLYARAFASLFLVPDLSMLGYLRGPRVGAVCYDAAHSYVGPLALLGVGGLAAAPTAVAIALIWIAHVGFDRALGYGLKYGTAFRDTHLGRV